MIRRPRTFKLSLQQWLAIAVIMALLAAAWYSRDALRYHLSNIDEAKSWLHSLGAWGPIVLILTNATQIVVAPIPGYLVQIAAGWVYGVWPGALYGVLGLALGALVATSLARALGRPFVLRIIGEERLARYEHVSKANSAWLWMLLFMGPVGDIPYFLAGLSRYPILRVVAIAVLVRTPSVTVAAAVGAGILTIDLNALLRPQIFVPALALGLVLLVAFWRYSDHLRGWWENSLRRRQPAATLLEQASEPPLLPLSPGPRIHPDGYSESSLL